MTVSVSVAQRRTRLVERHRLAVAADSVVDAVDAMIALHGTDPTAVYLSAWARTGCAPEQVDEAIYVERSLVRMLGMRRTMFVVPAGLVPAVQAACTDDVAKRLRRQLEKDLATGGVGDGDPGGWLRDVGSGVLRVLHARAGGASGAQLSEGEPRLRTQLSVAPDKSYGGTFNITSRVLTLLGAEGHLVRGHRRGGWSSGQFEWFAASTWLGTAADGGGPDGGAARVELARRWLRSFGPAPYPTCSGGAAGRAGRPRRRWPRCRRSRWSWTGSRASRWRTTSSSPIRSRPPRRCCPRSTRRRWGGRHGTGSSARTGRRCSTGPATSARPSGGRAGWWAAGRSARPGEVVLRLLEDIGADGAAAVSGQAARLEAWLGANRVTPRFRTPLERELSA